MTVFFDYLLKASFQGSIVILAVIALRMLLKKAPKSFFCLLWLLAGLRLVLPFEIQSSLSLQPRLEDTNLSVQAEQPVQVPDILIQNPQGQPLDVPADPVQTPNLPEGNWENTQTESFLYSVEDGAIKPIRYGDIAAQIWILGLAVMLAASAVSYFRLKRRIREAYLVENGCFECPGLETAFVLGFLPPKIYLPVGLSDREKAFIYDHENTHIARHDHWHKLLGYAVLSIHWFNPLVWLAYHLLCRDMELACDEHVVRNMTLPERKAYSAALLSCGSHTARIAACPVAFGESNPKKRIINVLNYKKPTFWISLLAVIAVIFVSVCLLTSPQEKDPLERLSQALEAYQSKGSWHIQTEFIYENRPAATRCEMDIWQEEDRWYRISTMELADGNLQTTGYVSENDVQYTFFVSGVYHPEYRRWSLAEEDQRWYPYWLPRFELKEEEIAEIREEKPEEGSIITTILDPASAGEQYTQLYIRWHLDKKGNLTHVERYEQFTTTEDGETFLMGIQMDISLLPTNAEAVKMEIDSALAELPEDIRQETAAAEAENLVKCREAFAQWAGHENYLVYQHNSYYGIAYLNSSADINYWKSGEDWLYIASVPDADNGRIFYRMKKDGVEYQQEFYDTLSGHPEGWPWFVAEDVSDCMDGNWFDQFRWDKSTIQYEGSDFVDGKKKVTLLVEEDPSAFGQYVPYTAEFTFNDRGVPVSVKLTLAEDDIEHKFESVYIVDNTVDASAEINAAYEEYLHGLSEEQDQSIPNEKKLEKCHVALEEYQSQGIWAIQEENSFWGQGALNNSSTSQWFGYGDDYLKWAAIPNGGGADTWWDLQVDGKAYHRQGWIAENGEESASPWEKGSTDNQTIYPHWPLLYDWVGADIRFKEQGTADSMDYVTVTIQGSPFPEDPDPIREYQVTFFFRNDVLQVIELTYERTDSLGGGTRRYDLYAFAPSYAVNKISQCYEEAQTLAGKNG